MTAVARALVRVPLRVPLRVPRLEWPRPLNRWYDGRCRTATARHRAQTRSLSRRPSRSRSAHPTSWHRQSGRSFSDTARSPASCARDPGRRVRREKVPAPRATCFVMRASGSVLCVADAPLAERCKDREDYTGMSFASRSATIVTLPTMGITLVRACTPSSRS